VYVRGAQVCTVAALAFGVFYSQLPAASVDAVGGMRAIVAAIATGCVIGLAVGIHLGRTIAAPTSTHMKQD